MIFTKNFKVVIGFIAVWVAFSVSSQAQLNDAASLDKRGTQSGEAKSSQSLSTLGEKKSNGNDDQKMMQTFDNIISSCIESQFDGLDTLHLNAINLKIIARFSFKEDGSVDGTPELILGDDDEQPKVLTPITRQVLQATYAAISKCSPYPLPADKYSMWRHIEVVLYPLGKIR